VPKYRIIVIFYLVKHHHDALFRDTSYAYFMKNRLLAHGSSYWPRLPGLLRQWRFGAFVTIHSGGSARELHPVPFFSLVFVAPGSNRSQGLFYALENNEN
jgi:hypothetical protein